MTWQKNWEVGVDRFKRSVFVMMGLVMFAMGKPIFSEGEIEYPTMRAVVDSLAAHESQWNLFMLYTMNADTPGYV